MERFADLFDQAQAHIDRETERAIRLIRSRTAAGGGRADCAECGAPIPELRRRHLPGVQRCMPCQEEFEKTTRWSAP